METSSILLEHLVIKITHRIYIYICIQQGGDLASSTKTLRWDFIFTLYTQGYLKVALFCTTQTHTTQFAIYKIALLLYFIYIESKHTSRIHTNRWFSRIYQSHKKRDALHVFRITKAHHIQTLYFTIYAYTYASIYMLLCLCICYLRSCRPQSIVQRILYLLTTTVFWCWRSHVRASY